MYSVTQVELFCCCCYCLLSSTKELIFPLRQWEIYFCKWFPVLCIKYRKGWGFSRVLWIARVLTSKLGGGGCRGVWRHPTKSCVLTPLVSKRSIEWKFNHISIFNPWHYTIHYICAILPLSTATSTINYLEIVYSCKWKPLIYRSIETRQCSHFTCISAWLIGYLHELSPQ